MGRVLQRRNDTEENTFFFFFCPLPKSYSPAVDTANA